jgi:hypothetical protein
MVPDDGAFDSGVDSNQHPGRLFGNREEWYNIVGSSMRSFCLLTPVKVKTVVQEGNYVIHAHL